MKPSVGDWVSTMGMSRGLARALRLPLDMTLSDFLSAYIVDFDDPGDETVAEQLYRFLKGRDKEALAADRTYHRQRAEFMTLGSRRHHNFLDILAHSLEKRPEPEPSPYHVDIESAVRKAEKRRSGPTDGDEPLAKKAKEVLDPTEVDGEEADLDFLL